MRRPSTASVPTVAGLVLVTSVVVVGLPVVTAPTLTPRPVAPVTTTLALRPVSLPSTLSFTGSPSRRVLADTGAHRTRRFGLAGVTWKHGSLPAGTHLEMRVRKAGGWSGWTALSLPDGGPADGSRDARAAAARGISATEPVWLGESTGAQARLVGTAGVPEAPPAGMALVLVDGGSSPTDSTPGAPATLGGGVAEAAAAQPTVYTRAQWGADESLRRYNSGCGTPDYGSTVKMGFVHHTDSGNGYSAASVPSILRSIYAYHVKSNGWCDIGYNFLVDRFGRVWEGRYGGITRPVIGAHTGGFNTDSFGVSLIGTFSSVAPPAAMLTGAEKLFAWRLGAYYRNPLAKTTMHAASFSGSRYAAGSTVTFNVVSGHRDADTTTCPGSAAYAKLAAFRTAVKSFIGAGLVAPSVSPTSIRMSSGQRVTVHAGVLATQAWKMTVTDATGTVVRALTGSATPTAAVSTAWDGTGDLGVPAPPGTYTLALSSTSSTSTAVPYSVKVTVKPPVTATGPAQVGYGQPLTLTGTAPAGSSVVIALSRNGKALPATTVNATATSTWTTTFAADGDYTWNATADGYTTPHGSTTIIPVVTSPVPTSGGQVFVPAGNTVTVAGTALPSVGSPVSVRSTPLNGAAASTVSAPVAANGSWSTVLRPATAATIVVTDARSGKAPTFTVFPVAGPTAAGPTTGYSGRTVHLTGNAGHAPVAVHLSTKAAGASTYTALATVKAATSGTYVLTLTLPTTSSPTSLGWRVSTGYGADRSGTFSVLPLFAPTGSAPATGGFGARVLYTGTAVPGDPVTFWTHRLGATTFTRLLTTKARSTGTWAVSTALRGDTVWKVTTPTGATAPATVRVAPTLVAPATVAPSTVVTFQGTALPGQKLSLYSQLKGAPTRSLLGTLTVASTGRWSLARRVTSTARFWAISHSQLSAVRTVTTQ